MTPSKAELKTLLAMLKTEIDCREYVLTANKRLFNTLTEQLFELERSAPSSYRRHLPKYYDIAVPKELNL
jgi:hypothetical protein